LKSLKGNNQIAADLIQAGGKTSPSVVYEHTQTAWNKKTFHSSERNPLVVLIVVLFAD
jgi:hypothetical protein